MGYSDAFYVAHCISCACCACAKIIKKNKKLLHCSCAEIEKSNISPIIMPSHRQTVVFLKTIAFLSICTSIIIYFDKESMSVLNRKFILTQTTQITQRMFNYGLKFKFKARINQRC